ncbi:MAG: RluA family pseudouridine synthase [Planctomycetaceae bacterium]|nr:RluA family pseudouridine synthase [Planctomycetaceae bacterium]
MLPLVIYEDEAIVAFAKPSGLLVVRDRWDHELANLVDLVHEAGHAEWSNVHRIDRDTSGVILFAKHREALNHVARQFEERTVAKTYVALVSPTPKSTTGTIDAPLADDPRRRGRMIVGHRGAESQTDYEVLEEWRGRWAWVQLRPRTGRTHQLRVHMATLGSPIVCDPFYGSAAPLLLSQFKRNYRPTRDVEPPQLDRLALHAESLAITHPSTAEPLTISAPLPDDLTFALKQLRRYA